jgi:glutamate formiminotransferase
MVATEVFPFVPVIPTNFNDLLGLSNQFAATVAKALRVFIQLM